MPKAPEEKYLIASTTCGDGEVCNVYDLGDDWRLGLYDTGQAYFIMPNGGRFDLEKGEMDRLKEIIKAR